MISFYLLVLALVLALTFDSVREVGADETAPVLAPRKEVVQRVAITYPNKTANASFVPRREQLRIEHEIRMQALRKEYKEWCSTNRELDRVRSQMNFSNHKEEKNIGNVVYFEGRNYRPKQGSTA